MELTLYEGGLYEFLYFYILMVLVATVPLGIGIVLIKERAYGFQNLALGISCVFIAIFISSFSVAPKTLDIPDLISGTYDMEIGKLKDVSIKTDGKNGSKYITKFFVNGKEFEIKSPEFKIEENSNKRVIVEYLPHSQYVISVTRR